MSVLSIDPKTLSTKELHGYLLSSVAPRPIALASTLDKDGGLNLAPFSFFNVFSANPPILIFSPARRVRDNTTKHTLDNILSLKEVVINIVDYDIAYQTSLAGTEYPSDVDEFVKSGLTPIASNTIRPFRVKESPVQFECVVNDIISLGKDGGAGNLVISEIVHIHVRRDILDEQNKIIPSKLRLVGRMGGDYYSKAFGDSLFTWAHPVNRLGVGFDNLPKDVLESDILSANDLAKLASTALLPNETEVNEYKLTVVSDIFIESENPTVLKSKLHNKAKELLHLGDVAQAWKVLLTFNDK